MKNINLSVLEKLYIYLRCRKDLKNNRFCDIKTGTPFYQNGYSRFEKGNKTSYPHSFQEKEEGNATILVVSPFVTTELSQLIAKKDKILAKRICVIKYKKNYKVAHKICKFPDALAFLDDQIRTIEGEIACLDAEYKAVVSDFQEKYDNYVSWKKNKLADACVKEVYARRDEHKSEKKSRFEDLILLLSEKIRIIEVVNARINAFKVWRFSRIRYYYGIASARSIKLPVFVYSNEELSTVAKQDFDMEYSGELENAKKRFEELVSAISFSTDDIIIINKEMSFTG